MGKSRSAGNCRLQADFDCRSPGGDDPLHGRRQIPSPTMDGKAIVGMITGHETWMAEGKDFLAAYHELHDKIIG